MEYLFLLHSLNKFKKMAIEELTWDCFCNCSCSICIDKYYSYLIVFLCCQFDEIKTRVEESDNKELQHEVKRIERELIAGYHLIDVDLENFLFNTIYSKRLPQDGYRQRSFMRKRAISANRILRDNKTQN